MIISLSSYRKVINVDAIQKVLSEFRTMCGEGGSWRGYNLSLTLERHTGLSRRTVTNCVKKLQLLDVVSGQRLVRRAQPLSAPGGEQPALYVWEILKPDAQIVLEGEGYKI